MKYKFKKHPSKLATLIVTFGAGARVSYNTKYPNGIAHYVEHVRFKGTEKYTSKELTQKIADVGGSWNAGTSTDFVYYYITVPEENIEVAFECLAEIVLHPIFPKEELEKEKEVVCQEIRMYNDDIDTLVNYKMMSTVFNNALTIPVIGDEESVQSITRDDIIRFNEEFYSKEHMLISLGANVDYEYLAEKYFGMPDDVLLFSPPSENVEYKNTEEHIVFKDGQLQDSVLICFGSDELLKLSNTSRAKIKVFSSIFGGGSASRLFMKVREDLGLVYGIGSYDNDGMDGSLYEIYTSTDPENLEKVISAIEEEIDIIKSEPPTEIELNRAKNMIRSAYYGSLDTSHSSIIYTIYEEFLGYTTGSKFLAEIDAVTAEDVHNIAKSIFNSNKYKVIGTGKGGE